MKKIIYFILCLLVLGSLMGCEKLKGEKGDQGQQGNQGIKGDSGASVLISTKTYSGTPASNPFTINCPEIKNIEGQTVDVYLISANSRILKLPVSYAVEFTWGVSTYTITMSHYYYIDGQNIILKTNAGPVLNTSSPGEANPIASLADLNAYDANTHVFSWTQNSYIISIKTYSKAPHRTMSDNKYRLDKTMYDELIYGRELTNNN